MPVELKIDKRSIEQTKRFYADLQSRVTHGDRFFQRAAMIMHRQVMDNFKKEQGPDGGKWARLKKKRKRGGSKVLQDTGILRSSILFRGHRANAEVKTNLKYAATHQFGDKRRGIPARPYMWMPDQLRKDLTDQYGRYIATGKF